MESTMGIVLAERGYPSNKLCSDCGLRNDQLALGERAWACAGCGAHHDRDVNAAVNLQRLATGAHGATRGESGGNAGHCRRPSPGGRRESNACQARARSVPRLGAGRDR